MSTKTEAERHARREADRERAVAAVEALQGAAPGHVRAADLLAEITRLTDLPDVAHDAMLTIAVARGGLWLWLTAQRTLTAVAVERGVRRQMHSRIGGLRLRPTGSVRTSPTAARGVRPARTTSSSEIWAEMDRTRGRTWPSRT